MYDVINKAVPLVAKYLQPSERKAETVQGLWYVAGKFIKKMGFLVTTASFVTWFVNASYLPSIMAGLYAITMLVIYLDYRHKSKYNQFEINRQSSSSVWGCIMGKLNPPIKALFVCLVLFNISIFWLLQYTHMTQDMLVNIPSLPFATIPCLAIISAASLLIMPLKLWQYYRDRTTKDHALGDEYVNAKLLYFQLDGRRRMRALVRGFSEWLMVFHNSFFLMLSGLSLGFFTLGSFTPYALSTLTLLAGFIATRVSMSTGKFSRFYLDKKLARQSDELVWDEKEKKLFVTNEIFVIDQPSEHPMPTSV